MGIVQAYSEMTSINSPAHTSNRAVFIVNCEELWGGTIWSIPEEHSGFQSYCNDITRAPIDQIQVKIIYNVRSIQCPLRTLQTKKLIDNAVLDSHDIYHNSSSILSKPA